MTTRDKLAVYLEQHDLAEVLESSVLGYRKHLDALEAIVNEARDEAIDQAADMVQSASGGVFLLDSGKPINLNLQPLANGMRALKVSK